VRILLIGNFAPDRQESMLRFERLLSGGFAALGHDVETWSPEPSAAGLIRYRYGGFPKYLGYFDKFVLFPRRVHIVDQANCVYGPLFAGIPRLVTCHDLLQIRASLGEIPEHPLRPHSRRYQAWILARMRRMPLAVCASTKTYGDFLRVTGLPSERARVIPNGLNYPYAPLPREEALGILQDALAERGQPGLLGEGDPRGFIVNVGGGQWYKNRPALLRIYAALRRTLVPAPRLLMVGKVLSPECTALARELGVAPDLLHLSNLSNRQLEAAYGAAEGLIFPSLDEGFGWPVAEAQACGCPVFTSNRAPMTEVGGDGAVYFDPTDPEGAAATIARAWPARAEFARRGIARTVLWDPRLMIERYLRVYEERAGAAAPLATR
jgi:glycosyltransferase involved in cell wall biosynthesis